MPGRPDPLDALDTARRQVDQLPESYRAPILAAIDRVERQALETFEALDEVRRIHRLAVELYVRDQPAARNGDNDNETPETESDAATLAFHLRALLTGDVDPTTRWTTRVLESAATLLEQLDRFDTRHAAQCLHNSAEEIASLAPKLKELPTTD